jgi:MA3 domain
MSTASSRASRLRCTSRLSCPRNPWWVASHQRPFAATCYLLTRAARCADATLKFQAARERIRVMLLEYVASGDVPEVERCLRALATPFLHHEVVKQATLIALSDPRHAKVRPARSSCRPVAFLSLDFLSPGFRSR